MKRIFPFIITNLAVSPWPLQGILHTFVIFLARIIGGVVDRVLLKNDRADSGIGFFFSRRREFRADRGGANCAGTGNVIGALEAVKRSQGEPLPPQMRAFGINTGGSGGFVRLFMSHPPWMSGFRPCANLRA